MIEKIIVKKKAIEKKGKLMKVKEKDAAAMGKLMTQKVSAAASKCDKFIKL